MRAEQPALQGRDSPVRALQGIGFGPVGLGLDDSVVRPISEALFAVAGVTVRGDGSSRRDLGIGEAFHSFSVVVFRLRHADAAVGFGGDQHQRFSCPFGPYECFIYFNVMTQFLAVRPEQRRTQLMEPRPRRIVRTEPHDPLQFLRGDAALARRDLEHCAELHLEGLVRLMKKRARRQARLMTAVSALERRALALSPHVRRGALRARGASAPAGFNPVRAAIRLGREFRLELDRRLREIAPQRILALLGHGHVPVLSWNINGL